MNIIENVKQSFNIFKIMTPMNVVAAVIEILVIAYCICTVLLWLRNTRAWTLLRGIIVIAVILFVAWWFDFSVILYLVRISAQYVIIMLIVVFQADLRAGLEHIGRQKFFAKVLPSINKFTKKSTEMTLNEIAVAAFLMGKVKTGALIVIEQTESLEDVERTGIGIGGKVTRQLLINIFEKNTPLHDGAVLVVGDIIKAATCYLPLSKDDNISKALGTRHRAALGISEISDSITVVVSEETGRVSVAEGGKITVMDNEEELLDVLMGRVVHLKDVDKKGVIEKFKEKRANNIKKKDSSKKKEVM